MIQNITIIGAGNVAAHLGKALFESGYNIVEIVGRNPANVKELANRFSANGILNITNINHSSQLYIIAVNDDSIVEVCNSMPKVDGVVVHTSGSIGFESIKKFNRFGVLYPFQTLSKNKSIAFKEVQLLIEGSDCEVESLIMQVASDLSSKVMVTTYEQRKQLHIAAIFASNFVNHFYSIAYAFLKEKGLPFELLLPLIDETTDKIKYLEPQLAQTGPAVRGDQSVMDKHIEVLKDNPDYKLIYELLSKSIQKGM